MQLNDLFRVLKKGKLSIILYSTKLHFKTEGKGLPWWSMRIQSLVGELNSHMPRAAKPMGHTTEHSETHLPQLQRSQRAAAKGPAGHRKVPHTTPETQHSPT